MGASLRLVLQPQDLDSPTAHGWTRALSPITNSRVVQETNDSSLVCRAEVLHRRAHAVEARHQVRRHGQRPTSVDKGAVIARGQGYRPSVQTEMIVSPELDGRKPETGDVHELPRPWPGAVVETLQVAALRGGVDRVLDTGNRANDDRQVRGDQKVFMVVPLPTVAVLPRTGSRRVAGANADPRWPRTSPTSRLPP